MVSPQNSHVEVLTLNIPEYDVFGNEIVLISLVKQRSQGSRVGPSPYMTGVLIKRENVDTDADTRGGKTT